jgi:plastocyanin
MGMLMMAAAAVMFALGCARKEAPPSTGGTIATGLGPSFDPAAGTAAITGRVVVEGQIPPVAKLRMTSDPYCAVTHKEPVDSDEVLVSNGRVQNVFVYVKQGLEKYTFRPPSDAVTLTQEGCRFSPHVAGIMVGQKLAIVNNDPTLHNIRCVAANNPQFNLAQAVKGMRTEKTFVTPEVMVRMRCDVHRWMSSYFGVLPHPYFGVTDREGAFALKNLPPGDYLLEAWHEFFGSQTQKVTVGDRETKEITFTFKQGA